MAINSHEKEGKKVGKNQAVKEEKERSFCLAIGEERKGCFSLQGWQFLENGEKDLKYDFRVSKEKKSKVWVVFGLRRESAESLEKERKE